MTQTIIFDFDGTLADTFNLFKIIVNKLAPKYKYSSMNDSQIESMRGLGAKAVLKVLNLSWIKTPFWVFDAKREMSKHIADIKTFDELPNVLKELKNKYYKLGILTSNDLKNVELFLRSNNFDMFDFIYSAKSLFGKDKALNHLIKKYNLKKEEIVYVGDEVRDIEACKLAGVKVAAVAWGYNNEEALRSAKPDFFIQTPSELLHPL